MYLDEMLEITKEQADDMQGASMAADHGIRILHALCTASRFTSCFGITDHGLKYQASKARQHFVDAIAALDAAEASILAANREDDGTAECNQCGDVYETKFHDACPICAVKIDEILTAAGEDARQVRDDYARAVGAPR